MAKHALIVWGGWSGHAPKEVGAAFADVLRADGFAVEVRDTLDAFTDASLMASLDLIVPVWTMGKISNDQANAAIEAVRDRGVGIAGCHGGMCDAFRDHTEWQFMTGGQFVAHPGNDGTDYRVKIIKGSSPIVDGIDDYDVSSEQYYMHVDPANKVLATTSFPTVDGPHAVNGPVEMPVVWTRGFGKGRVFYHALGHDLKTITAEPTMMMMRRGFAWAAR
jgi:type 1 glutamine amidotransferase